MLEFFAHAIFIQSLPSTFFFSSPISRESIFLEIFKLIFYFIHTICLCLIQETPIFFLKKINPKLNRTKLITKNSKLITNSRLKILQSNNIVVNKLIIKKLIIIKEDSNLTNYVNVGFPNRPPKYYIQQVKYDK